MPSQVQAAMHASPKTLEPLILQFLSTQRHAYQRPAILKGVTPLAEARGFAQPEMTALSKALKALKIQNRITSPQLGWWSVGGESGALGNANAMLEEINDPYELPYGKKSIQVLRRIGSGVEAVYVLQFERHVEVANAQGDEWWKCKIGISKNVASRLINGISETYIESKPQVGLLILCENCALVEKVLHSSLKAVGQHDKEAHGAEWFHTSPHHVEVFYRAWLTDCDALRNRR